MIWWAVYLIGSTVLFCAGFGIGRGLKKGELHDEYWRGVREMREAQQKIDRNPNLN